MSAQLSDFNRQHELYKLLLRNYSAYDKMYEAYLSVGLKAFNMELGTIAQIQARKYTILAVLPLDYGIKCGQTFKLSQTYCAEAVKKRKTIAFHKISQEVCYYNQSAKNPLQMESVISAPIWVNDEIYGTMCFTSPKPQKKPFPKEDIEFISLLAKGLATLVEHNLLEQEKNKATDALRDNIALFTSAFDYAPIGMALVSTKGKWLKVNKALQKILGYDEQQLLKMNYRSISHPDDLKEGIRLAVDLLNNKIPTYQIEKRYITQSQKTIWVNLSVSLVRYEDGRPRYFISQIEDIDKRKRTEIELEKKQRSLRYANNKLIKLATHDMLTGLANRRLLKEKFTEEFNRSVKKNNTFSMAIIDIDRFKNYNDKFGHLEGDEALKKVAAVASMMKRRSDTLARFGGEEFILLLPQTDKCGCMTLCERIRAAIEKIDDLKIQLTISIGCTTYCPVEEDANDSLLLEKILWHADRALYYAKESGRNKVCHFD